MVRSPWSNKYDPPLDDGALPSDKLRTLEVQANQAFDTYRELYFEGGICSVYLWDLDNGFAGVVLLKKGMGINDYHFVIVCAHHVGDLNNGLPMDYYSTLFVIYFRTLTTFKFSRLK